MTLTIQKENFDSIYDQVLPDAYFCRLYPLNYQIPAHGTSVVRRVIEYLKQVKGKQKITILDLCCSYGINAMLLKSTLTLNEIYRHFLNRQARHNSCNDSLSCIVSDKQFFVQHKNNSQDLNIIGIDISRNAINYALKTRLLDQGWSTNLENQCVPVSLAQELPKVDLITVTGGLSYIGVRTFQALLKGCIPHKPWICCFPLRTVNCEPLINTLRQFDLAVSFAEDRLFPQRYFASDQEKKSVFNSLESSRLHIKSEIEHNYLCAQLMLAVPEKTKALLSILLDYSNYNSSIAYC